MASMRNKLEEEASSIAKRDAVLALLNLRGKYSSKEKQLERLIVANLETIAETINKGALTEIKLEEARVAAQEQQAEEQIVQRIDSLVPGALVIASFLGIGIGLIAVAYFN